MKEKNNDIDEKIKIELKNLKNKITCTHKYAFFTAIILGLLLHFTLYSSQITTTDGFLYGSRYIAGEWEISLGRWCIVLLNKLRFGLVSPAYITFFSIFIIAISSVLIIDILEINKKLTAILISATVVVAPFVYQTLLYEFTADTYFIAWLLAILSVFLYKRKKRILMVIAIILMMGIYQSYINVVMSLGLFWGVIKFWENKCNVKELIKELVIFYIICFVGIILYYFITNLILFITGVEFSKYNGASSNGFLEILKYFPLGIIMSYNSTLNYYFTDGILNNTIYLRSIYFLIMFGIIFIKILKGNDNIKSCFLIYLLLLVPIILAFSDIIIINKKINILMSASFICPILFFIKLIELDKKRILKFIEISLVLVVLYTYAIMGEATYIGLKQNYEQVYNRLSRVVERIENHELFEKGMKVAFIGDFEYFNDLKIYEISNGDRNDLGVFRKVQPPSLNGILKDKFAVDFEVYDLQNKKEEDYEKYMEYKIAFHEMTRFPDKDCIRVINDIMIVKLGDKDL